MWLSSKSLFADLVLLYIFSWLVETKNPRFFPPFYAYLKNSYAEPSMAWISHVLYAPMAPALNFSSQRAGFFPLWFSFVKDLWKKKKCEKKSVKMTP